MTTPQATQDRPTITSNLRLPGQYEDTETGLYYNWNRYYSPDEGRYVTSDPIGLEGGINPYLYVGANPLGYYDPYGLFGMDNIWGGVYWVTGGRSPSQGFVNFSAGMGDVILFGQGQRLRNWLNIDGGVNQCSAAYSNGEWAGIAISMVTGGAGGKAALPKALKTLPNGIKGKIGETLSYAKNRLLGNKHIASQRPISEYFAGNYRSIADSIWRGRNGKLYVVESKFGKSDLRKAQRIARKGLGDQYHVEKWTYPFFGKVGGIGGAGIAGGASGLLNPDVECGCQ